MDYVKGIHRGFAFVEFEDPDDAEEAIFNMDGSELLGKTIRVSLAQPNQVNKLSTSEAIWKSDDWYQKQVVGKDAEEDAEQMAKVQDTKVLHEL
jgi:peptidyl-prolyl isomerase E (cyclophilin E)